MSVLVVTWPSAELAVAPSALRHRENEEVHGENPAWFAEADNLARNRSFLVVTRQRGPMSILKRLFGSASGEMKAAGARAGDCCELCKKDLRGERNWGFECSNCTSRLPNPESYKISARFCYECLAKRSFRAMPPDPRVLSSMKNMIERTCPQCSGPLTDSIL
jgi:hypothetical protein